MPYVEATINEILRFGNISPAGVFREVTKDTTLRGYHLTKPRRRNAEAISFHTAFKMCRSSTGSLSSGRARLWFLVVGQRVCPGEQLARMELFMFFTSLLQNLDIFLDDKEHRPDFSYTSGLVRAPHPYKLSCRTQPQSFMQNAEK
ncbi:hypothetical protein NDU88_001190 [Pleurodeles waltl]|uniref:Uncharacterized protein n=1 Tax=Pleurodeles waltl TaxID=8319 RepID=A0AAV7KVK0_PLEWA|nr:hypothetical protein NDU88_001190 [Pleurodeles waltl]